ncbi:MAG: glucose-6-phosphate isomerase [Oligoflexia bacterium]|nr:glucose-6-phosphate isomerase [Oligoflexia bacterium]
MFSINWDSAVNNELNELLRVTAGQAYSALEKTLSKRESGKIGFMDLVFREKEISRVKKLAAKTAKEFDTLIVLGIGGSSLGGKTINAALMNNFDYNRKKVFYADNVDPDYFHELISSLDLKKTAFNVISKSGSTAETMAQFLVVYDLLCKKLGKEEAVKRIIMTTDPKSGALRPLEKSIGFETLEIPQNVGGRFSVLSDVGLFPSAFSGVDVDSLIKGAASVLETGTGKDMEKNPVLKYSLLKYLYCQKGFMNSVMMPYSTKLFELSAWYVQLWAESLGKKGMGQTPIPAIGATDQHSQLQLFMEGPRDKFITFIGVENSRNKTEIPCFEQEIDAFDYLSGHTMQELIRCEMLSTQRALFENGVPSVRIELPELNAENVGALFMFFEMAVAITGDLMEIDAFNQPGVELSKKYTYQMMGRKGY